MRLAVLEIFSNISKQTRLRTVYAAKSGQISAKKSSSNPKLIIVFKSPLVGIASNKKNLKIRSILRHSFVFWHCRLENTRGLYLSVIRKILNSFLACKAIFNLGRGKKGECHYFFLISNSLLLTALFHICFIYDFLKKHCVKNSYAYQRQKMISKSQHGIVRVQFWRFWSQIKWIMSCRFIDGGVKILFNRQKKICYRFSQRGL